MSKMAAMALMIIGVVCFFVGLVFYSTSNKSASDTLASNASVSNISTSNTSSSGTSASSTATPSVSTQDNSASNTSAELIEKASTSDKDELEKIINMAIADGVLTMNERNIIKQIADTKKLNYDDIIEEIENRMSQSTGIAETEIIDINKKNGIDFEKYIVQKFNRKFFKIKEWTGDKYVKGVYAETTQQPDLLLELKINSRTAEFAVECKRKSTLYRGGIEVASPEQFIRYQKFESSRQIPVFIAVGVGGKGANPEQLYIVPLQEVESNFIPIKALKKFQKEEGDMFFFDLDTKKLK